MSSRSPGGQARERVQQHRRLQPELLGRGGIGNADYERRRPDLQEMADPRGVGHQLCDEQLPGLSPRRIVELVLDAKSRRDLGQQVRQAAHRATGHPTRPSRPGSTCHAVAAATSAGSRSASAVVVTNAWGRPPMRRTR